MSTFGEIVEPGTRSAWEDWDENIQEDSHSKLLWQEEVNVPVQIRTLFILEGRQLANNITTLNNLKLEPVNSIPEVNLKLYQTQGSDIFVCILKDYNLLLASEVIELLKPYISISTDVIAVLTKPLVEYQAMNMSQDFVIRSVSTSKPVPASIVNTIPKLEQPNIISGVTAGVISLREILNQPGVAIICYLECNEEYQINELQDLLRQLNFGTAQSQPSSILNSNLYI